MKSIQENYAVKTFYLQDDGIFPNNSLPALLYKGILELPRMFPATFIQRLFEKNNWANSWKEGIETVQHYHSIAHEVLGAFKGKTVLQLGGDNGPEVVFEKGDVLILPAGVAHKNLGAERDIQCVGAYPEGMAFDMEYGNPGERPQTDENIAKVELPKQDPVQGIKGPIYDFWKLL